MATENRNRQAPQAGSTLLLPVYVKVEASTVMESLNAENVAVATECFHCPAAFRGRCDMVTLPPRSQGLETKGGLVKLNLIK
ncbi:hypothetical protein E4U41_004944 [Claviceps citrina]|nr:hypothetical protein E4U41_004944 [Claviceps citrina]